MKFAEALKSILCDSEKGIDWNKIVKGKDFELSFIPCTYNDGSVIVNVYYSGHKNKVYNQYMFNEYMCTTEKYFNRINYVEQDELNGFLEKEYLFEKEEVEII